MPATFNTAQSDTSRARPLTDAAFTALCQKFALPETAPLAIAVSGGPDSMALAYLMRRWRPPPARLIAFIVDHRLRTESTAEAKATAKQLAALGIPAEILHWEHALVTTRLHDTARNARYDLLAAACRRHAIAHLFLAHHCDDQAETILMRLAKGSGIDGLAGMAAIASRDGINLLRPFLAMPKASLVAACDAARLAYISDPSNHAAKFARGRLRAIMPLLADEGLTLDRLADLADRARDASEALAHYTATFLAAASNRDQTGCLTIDRAALQAAPRAVALNALAACLQSIHPAPYPPERAALLSLFATLTADPPGKPRNLQGCRIAATAARIAIMREATAITASLPIAPGETVEWDNRWQITRDAACAIGACMVRQLGTPSHAIIDTLSPALRHATPQGRIRATLPALWHGEELRCIPSLSYETNHLTYARLMTADETKR